jgi:hypothetical protein
LRVQLDRYASRHAPTRWLVRVVNDGTYVLASDGERWHLEPADENTTADVTIIGTRNGLARFLTTPPAQRDLNNAELQITGSRPALRAMLKTIAVFPFAPQARAEGHRTRTKERT